MPCRCRRSASSGRRFSRREENCVSSPSRSRGGAAGRRRAFTSFSPGGSGARSPSDSSSRSFRGIFAGASRELAISAAFPSLARWDRENGSLVLGALAERKRKPRARRSCRADSCPSAKGSRPCRARSPRAWAAVSSGNPCGVGDAACGRRVEGLDVAGRAGGRPRRPGISGLRSPRGSCAPPRLRRPMRWRRFRTASRRASPGLALSRAPPPLRRIRLPRRPAGGAANPRSGVELESLLRPRAGWAGARTVFVGGARDPKAASLSDGEARRRWPPGTRRRPSAPRWPRARLGHALRPLDPAVRWRPPRAMEAVARAEARWPGPVLPRQLPRRSLRRRRRQAATLPAKPELTRR